MTRERFITIEEHFLNPAVGAASRVAMAQRSPGFGPAYDPASGLPHSPGLDVLTDLGEGRLAAMDAHGIDMQVISSLTTQMLDAAVAPQLVRETNDMLARAVQAHPDRFAGFAAIPTSTPLEAADELRRAVEELGFVGSLIHGRTDGRFLSDPAYERLLTAHEQLRVPLYLHPAPPPADVSARDYATGDLVVETRFATAGWGWHNETGIHFIQMVLAGVFDRHPDLQVVLGHWGEMVPWFIERLDGTLPQKATGLERTFREYVRQNAYITPSGMFSQAQLDYVVRQLGTDRLIMSIDHPFVDMDGTRDFLDAADLPDEAKTAFAHGNARRLLGLV